MTCDFIQSLFGHLLPGLPGLRHLQGNPERGVDLLVNGSRGGPGADLLAAPLRGRQHRRDHLVSADSLPQGRLGSVNAATPPWRGSNRIPGGLGDDE